MFPKKQLHLKILKNAIGNIKCIIFNIQHLVFDIILMIINIMMIETSYASFIKIKLKCSFNKEVVNEEI